MTVATKADQRTHPGHSLTGLLDVTSGIVP